MRQYSEDEMRAIYRDRMLVFLKVLRALRELASIKGVGIDKIIKGIDIGITECEGGLAKGLLEEALDDVDITSLTDTLRQD